jgi:hypothetical protein
MKFFNPLYDRVEKLNYFNPIDNNSIQKLEKKEINYTMLNFRESSVLREEDVKTIQKFSKSEFPTLFTNQNKIGRNQSQSLHKIENISLENKLNSKRKFLEEMIKEKRVEKNKLVKDINRLHRERDDLEAEIEVLNNLDHFASIEEQIKMRGINQEVQKTRSMDEENFMLLKKLKVNYFI